MSILSNKQGFSLSKLWTKNSTTQPSVGNGDGKNKIPQPLPLIGKLSEKSQYRIALSGIIVGIACTVGFGVLASRVSSFDQQVEADLVSVRINAEKLLTETRVSIQGEFDAFGRGRNSIDNLFDISERFTAMHGLPGAKPKANPFKIEWESMPWLEANVSPTLNKLLATASVKNPDAMISPLQDFLRTSDEILTSEVAVTDLYSIGQRILRSTEAMRSELEKIPPSADSDEARKQLSVLLKLASKLGVEKSETNEDVKALPKLTKDLVDATKAISAENTGHETSLGLLQFHAELMSASAASMVGSEESRVADVLASTQFIDQQAALMRAMDSMAIDKNAEFGLWVNTGIALGATMLFILLALLVNAKSAAISAWIAKNEVDVTDQAIIKLIEELAPISNGDLTARLTVTEHVTGALADSVNATTQEIQTAITMVKSSATEVNSSMEDIFYLIEESNETTRKAADLAQASINVSTDGAGIVDMAVEQMDVARERMQDVSKRVKRLGEVSQSIGQVVQIIEEVNEKTAILALNTSLRAAEAGEQGYAFRVVAEEIRKLSNSVMESLSQISSSILAIQTETSTVIATVESSTNDIVNSSKHWNAAKDALTKISDASHEIEKAVQDMNALSTKQSASASVAVKVISGLNESSARFQTAKEEQPAAE